MNVFRKFTRKSLAQNRTRTIVTLIGIILSMALFTAVIEGAYSGLRFLQDTEIEKNGAWQGYYSNLDQENIDELLSMPEIDKAAGLSLVGWGNIDSKNDFKPYLLVKSAAEGIEDLISIRLLSGRMPENSSEIILPNHLATNGKVVYELGDNISICVGKRVANNEVLSESTIFSPDLQEEITDTQEKTYTVVGFYERLDYTIEEYSCPGYTAITTDTPIESSTVFFTLKIPQKYYDFASSSPITDTAVPHSDLLQLYGSVRNGNLVTVIYGFAGVLCFLIAFGSISLIYNSFSISVSERTKQFGILKSVGATKKQIRSSVLYEALLLDIIAVPIGLLIGCVGIGITLYCLRDAFSSLITESTVQMKLVIAPAALAIAAVVCVITTLISALIPAKRAMKVPAIDAIRQTADVKIKGKDVKTSRTTEKLFGFEGMMAYKNFKRNRKRYRATIVSLFLSITLFISASSFCSYMKNAVGGVVSTGITTDISYKIYEPDAKLTSEDIHSMLLSASNITDSFYANVTSDFFRIDADLVDNSYFEVYRDRESFQAHPIDEFVMVYFVGDDDFRTLCSQNGLNADRYFKQDSPKALLYNEKVVVFNSEDGPAKWYSYSFVDKSKLPCTLYAQGTKEIDGYTNMGAREVDGKLEYIYYPNAYMDAYWPSHDDDSELDISKAMILTEEEATYKRYYDVDTVIEKLPFAIGENELALIYPMSVQEAIVSENQEVPSVFSYKSSDHKQTYSEMEKLLSDNHLDTSMLFDVASHEENSRLLIMVINIFSYGFIILISMIAIANVFNTISTNISLRRREFAMLKSIGMADKNFKKMMNYECVIYGLRSLLWGLPASFVLTYLIFRITGAAFEMQFYIPWYSIAIAVGSVFIVVFATMLYATGKIRKDNPIDALKNENI